MILSTVSTLDWLIVAAYLAASVLFGLLLAGRQRQASTESYLVAGRSLSWWLLLFSIVATETSTVTFLSLPGKSYTTTGDMTFLQLAIGYVIGRIVIVVVLLPLLFSGKYYTAYELLRQRFGHAVHRIAAVVFLVMRNLSDGFRLLLTGLLIESATGLGFVLCVCVLAVSTLVYTLLGGVTSVVWNDFLQFIVYMSGALVALAMLVWLAPDGWLGVWRFGQATGRTHLVNLSGSLTTPSITLLSGVLGGAALTMASHGADNLMVQRYLCARSQRGAGWALGLSGPVVAVQFLLFLLIGIALAHHHASGLATYDVERPDQAFIGFIVHEMPTGLRGIVIASVLAAAMSTLSSSLNASAGVLVRDLPHLFPARRPEDDSDTLQLRRAQWATAVLALLQTAIAVVAYRLAIQSSIIDSVLAIAGFSTGLLLGLYLLATAWRQPRQAAGVIGMACGLLACCYAAFVAHISWPWYSLIGSTVTLAVGSLIQCLYPPHPRPA